MSDVINPIEAALFANSNISREEKYKIAWDNLSSADPNVRANCMTWLTYRAIDGQVSYTDWLQHVAWATPENGRLSHRWRVSINTALCYVKILNRDLAGAIPHMRYVHAFDYTEVPGMLPNFLRVSSILARTLVDEREECRSVIESTITKWQSGVAGIDLMKHPSWPADQGFDVSALHHLLRTAEMIGMTSFRQDQTSWIDGFTGKEKGKPWMRCLLAVTKKAAPPDNDILTFATVLKTGGEYTAAHVERVRDMISAHYSKEFRFVCLTDDNAVDLSITVPLKRDFPGWWSKLELFEHDFGRVCYLDLDIVIRSSIDWIDGLSVSDDFFAMEDPWWKGTINSSFMLWRGPRTKKMNGFKMESQPENLPSGQVNSDQVWIDARIGRRTYIHPPLVGSYKAHGSNSASIMVYHGKPKPWDVVGLVVGDNHP